MRSATEILTAGVTDWTTPLSENYKRQNRQLTENIQHHADVQKQKLAKAKAEDPATGITNIIGFYNKKKQAIKALDKKADERALAKYNQYTPKQIEALKLIYKDENFKIEEEDADLFKQLQELKIKPELLEEVQKVSGRELNRMQKFFVRDKVSSSTFGVFRDTVLTGDPALKKEFDSYSDDPQAQARLYKNWVQTEIRASFPHISDKLFASVASEEINRMVSTVANAGKSSKATEQNTSRVVNFKNVDLISKLQALNTEDAGSQTVFDLQLETISEIDDRQYKFQDIPGGKTARQQATASVVADLYQLAFEEKLSYDNLDALFSDTSALDKHGSGKRNIPEAFFGDKGETETHLFKAVEQASALAAERRQASAIATIANVNDLAASGKLTEEKRNELLLPLLNFTYDDTKLKTQIEDLLELKIPTLEQQAKDKEIIDKLIASNNHINLTDAEIDASYSPAYAKLLKIRRDEDKALMSTLGYVDDDISATAALVGKMSSIKDTLNLQNVGANLKLLPHDARQLHTYLLKKRRSIFLGIARANPNDLQAGAKADAAFEQYLQENGFYVTQKTMKDGVDISGILSADGLGNFSRFNLFTQEEADKQTNRILTINEYDQEVKNLETNYRNVNAYAPGDTRRDQVLNTSGTAIDHHDIIGYFETVNKDNQIGFFSNEILLKARLYKISPAELIKRQTLAMLKDGTDEQKEILSNYGITENEVNSIPDLTTEILQSLENRAGLEFATQGTAKEFYSLINAKGIENLSQNQYERLVDLFETEDQFQEDVGLDETESTLQKKSRIELDTQNAKDELSRKEYLLKGRTGGDTELTTEESDQYIRQYHRPEVGMWYEIPSGGYMQWNGSTWVNQDRAGSPENQYLGEVSELDIVNSFRNF